MERQDDKRGTNRNMPPLEVVALTNVGLVRKINEDAVLIGTDLISEEKFGPRCFTLPGDMGP
jgi:hypothetical protein